METSSQIHAPAALIPEKDIRVSIVLEVGWAPESIWAL